jgi:hypothetical protein
MYQLTIDIFSKKCEVIKRISDNAFIPMDEQNTDYQAYLKWVAKGNEPLPAENE